MYIEVLLELQNKNIDQTFTYSVPEDLQSLIEIGKRVIVPFNKRALEGFILEIKDNIEDVTYKILPIKEVVDKEEILTPELIKIGEYLQSITLCSKSSAFNTMVPKALKASVKTNINKKYKTYIELNEYDNIKLTPKQLEIVKYLKTNGKTIKTNFSPSIIKTLLDKGIVKEIKEEEYRISNKDVEQVKKYKLNEYQSIAYKEIINHLNSNQKYLLYGITGSGKTEVYLQIIEYVLSTKKNAICLVPEISLTPQLINQFKSRFKDQVVALHSKLSDTERYDLWRLIKSDKVRIVIGTRSAIFAPISNLGIIIIDEEHSDSYKQENNPRYNAIDIAEYRASINNIPLVLGSATPTLDKMARASKGLYKLLNLPVRTNNQSLPSSIIVDMKEEIKKGNNVLSSVLKREIESAISRNEQVILLLNRLGYSTTITCSNCGFTYKCPNCDITLTYHKTSNNLRCHYCGYTLYKKDKCPNCKENLNFYGLGTEKLEEILKTEYKDLRIIRMDKDTTSKKDSYEKIFEDFKNYKYDILLGTQMISKGLDFPRVSLVGIINADTTLNIPDFRSGEKTFDLLYQASGRAGRKDTIGTVVIQTFNPENQILKYVCDEDYEGFYKYEMNIRKKLKYPPYYYLVSLKVTSKDYKMAEEESIKTTNYLKNNLDKDTIILGPTTSNIFKVNNIYRFQIIIKYRFDKKIMTTLKNLDNIYRVNNKVNLEIDINPIRI